MSDEKKPEEAVVNETDAQRPAGEAAPEPAAAAAPVKKANADRGESSRASSDVGALRAMALAVPFYGLALLGAWAAPHSARSILLERGWPPHATMALTCLAVSILIWKTAALRRQRRAFAMDLLPAGKARIGAAGAAELVDHLESIRGLRRERSFLVERLLRAVSQYAARGDVADAATANEADADADAAAVAASFATVKVIVWAMPILGLIGTVVGLSGAVGAFSHAMSGAEQLDTIKDSLREVTTGLAVAFDATFVALVASILVMLPMTWLQKAEDKLINDVDDYCVTRVIARLGERAADAATEGASGSSRAHEALVAALARPLTEMMAANTRLMDRLAEDRAAITSAERALADQMSTFTAALAEAAPALDRAAAGLERATAQTAPATERIAAELARVGGGVERVAAELDRSAAAVGPSFERALRDLDRTTAQVSQGVERAAAQIERAAAQIQDRVAPGVERAASQLERATAELGTGVERALAELGASTTVATDAALAAERAQDQLSRELGASRQLLTLLAAGLNAGDASKPRHANGTNGVHGTSAARGG